MWSKNKPLRTAAAKRHIEAVKMLPCCVCEATGPSDAHHIDQSSDFLTIPLCRDCHEGSFNGIHGQKRIWKTLKKTEQSCLGETIARLLYGVLP